MKNIFKSSLNNIIKFKEKIPASEKQIKNNNDMSLNTPVEELDLSVSGFNTFRKAGLKTVEDILNLRLHNLQKLKDTDTGTVREISNVIEDLKRFGYKPTFEEQIKNSLDGKSLNAPLEELNFSARAYNVLRSERLKTLKDIVEFGFSNIIYISNAGVGTVREIFKVIEKFIEAPASEKQIKNNNDMSLNTPIEELDLSVRAYNVLASRKLKTVKDIIEFGIDNVIEIPKAGIETIKDISKVIEPFIEESTFEEQVKNGYDDVLFSTPVEELDFPMRAFSAFEETGIKTVKDILNFKFHNLLKLKNVNHETIKRIKKEILLLPVKLSQEMEDISFVSIIENITSYMNTNYLSIIKARFGYDDEKHKTLEEIGRKNGITRERVRQIIVKELRNIKRKRKRKVLVSLIGNVERLLFQYKGIVSINDFAKDKYFTSGTRKQIRFMTNLIVALYTEQYRIVCEKYLTNLSDDEIEKLDSEIQKSALECRFPIEKKALTENIMVLAGPISKDYLNYQILNRGRAKILEGKVLSLGCISGYAGYHGSIPQQIKFVVKNIDIDRPMHFTEIAKLYKKHYVHEKEISKLEHAVHCYILSSKEFIIVGPGIFMLRSRFKVPDNIKIIVKVSEEILRELENISDTRYLIKELKKRKIDTGNLNLYSLKTILLEYPNFVGYVKSEVGIKELTAKYERKSLGELIYEVLASSHKALKTKEIHKRISKTRGFPETSVRQKLSNDTAFINIARSTYTVRENISSYEDKSKTVIDFAQKWSKRTQRPISTFLVNEVLREIEETTDLSSDFAEYVLENSPKFTKVRKGFYDLVEIC